VKKQTLSGVGPSPQPSTQTDPHSIPLPASGTGERKATAELRKLASQDKDSLICEGQKKPEVMQKYLHPPTSRSIAQPMQVGGDEIAERSPKAIKRDFRALGQLVEGSGAQVEFSSIPSVAGNSIERGRKTHLVNRWLRDWCHRSNFGFFDHGDMYTAPGLLVTGGVQLSQRGKRILGHELAGLIERALN